MHILDKNKDWYDWLEGIYGIDEKLFYDRRGSIKITSRPAPDYYTHLLPNYEQQQECEYWFSKEQFANCFKRTYNDKIYFSSDTDHGTGKLVPEYFRLVVGVWQYDFKVTRDLVLGMYPKLKEELLSKSEVTERFSDAPVYLIPPWENRYWFSIDKGLKPFFRKYTEDDVKKYIIVNPILSGTYIPNYVRAEDAWNSISEYLGKQLEKPIVDTRTDIEHIESAGFDKKTSFRKM